MQPRTDDVVEVNPLVPEEAWEYFCLDRIPYRTLLTIVYDRTGQHYSRGSGLQIFANGKRLAHAMSSPA